MKTLEKILLTSTLLVSTIFNSSCISQSRMYKIMDDEARNYCYKTGTCYREDSFYNKGQNSSKYVYNGRVYNNIRKKTIKNNYQDYKHKITKSHIKQYNKEYEHKMKTFKRFMVYQQKHNTMTKSKLDRIKKQYQKNRSKFTSSDYKYFKNYIKKESKKLELKTKPILNYKSKSYYFSKNARYDNNNNFNIIPEKNKLNNNSKLVSKKAYKFYKNHKHFPYIWGSKKLSNGGFDCSGFVRYILNQTGYKIPKTSLNTVQLNDYFSNNPLQFKKENKQHLTSGDILLFKYTTLSYPYHTAIYLGKYKKHHKVCESYIHSKGGKTKRGLRIDCLRNFDKKYINTVYKPL